MWTSQIDPAVNKPLPRSFIRNLKRAFSGQAQEDAVRAAKTGDFAFLGRFLENPAQHLDRDVVAKCLANEDDGMEQLTREFEMLQLRRQLYLRLGKIYEARRARSRQLGFRSQVK